MKMAQSVSNKCRIPPLSLLAVLVIVELLCLVNLTNCTKIFNIGWNTTNPIFRIDNTDHIIDVNKGNIPFEYDQVNIICPVYSPGTHEQDAEKYIIYNVSKEEYDTCRITNPNPRIIAVCDKPNKLMYFTITFRSFTPQPGGLEFRPGQDYYFISTSTNSDLHRRIGGRCSTNHMKVVFKVCCDPSKENDTNQKKALAARTTTTTSTTTRTTTSTTTTKLSTTSRPSTSSKPTSFKTALGPSINVKATTKKSEEFNRDKHPNDDIVKNEELTSRAANSVGRSHYRTVALSCLVMVLTTRLLSR